MNDKMLTLISAFALGTALTTSASADEAGVYVPPPPAVVDGSPPPALGYAAPPPAVVYASPPPAVVYAPRPPVVIYTPQSGPRCPSSI